MSFNNLPSVDRNFCNKYWAFTLAEVLISLVIIGVIAALTVNTLILKTQKEEHFSKLKKAFSMLSQATNQIIADEGPVKGWATSDVATYNRYKQKIIKAKDCGNNRGCFSQHKSGNHIYLNGQDDPGNWDTLPSFITADGIQVGFYPGNDSNPSYVMQIYIDTNGEKKPNKWGRDVFVFYLMPNGLSPGSCSETSDCHLSGRGTSCSCRVFKENGINY